MRTQPATNRLKTLAAVLCVISLLSVLALDHLSSRDIDRAAEYGEQHGLTTMDDWIHTYAHFKEQSKPYRIALRCVGYGSLALGLLLSLGLHKYVRSARSPNACLSGRADGRSVRIRVPPAARH